MGIEFIRSKAKRPWTKSWKAGFEHMKTPSLFDLDYVSAPRVLMMVVQPGCSYEPGTEVMLEQQKDHMVAIHGVHVAGRVLNVPTEIEEALLRSSGLALAVVERMSEFGDTAELRVK
jgi:hypothetical protein